MAAYTAGFILAIALIWFVRTETDEQPRFSEDEILMMSDYESPLFNEIDTVTAERDWSDYLKAVQIPDSLENVKYYELNYGGIHEFHVTGYTPDGNHFIAAVPVGKVNKE